MSNFAKNSLTIDQISKDALTKIANKYWLDRSDTILEPYDAHLIDDIYLNEISKSKFSFKRIMLLEFSQYLEKYLWKNYNPQQASLYHVLSIVIMINEKFRERVPVWDSFKCENSLKFSEFFNCVLKLCLNSFKDRYVNISYQEQSFLIKFLDNCINSLEVDMIRAEIQKICGLPIWISLNENRREQEFQKFPKLQKFWRAVQKNDLKLSKIEKERIDFERTFFFSIITKFTRLLKSFYYSLNTSEIEIDKELGEIQENAEEFLENDVSENFKSINSKYRLHYMERFLELFIDMEALLPTRRFFNTLLDDSNLLVHCHLSDLIQMTEYENDDKISDKNNLFKQLFKILKFYASFEIDDQSGEAKTESQIQEAHYEKLKSWQKGLFYLPNNFYSDCKNIYSYFIKS